MNLLSTTALSVSIAGHRICRDLEIRVGAGSRWAILGRNGVGKTTLLKTLAGLRAPDGGAVLLADTPLAAWPSRAAAQKIGVLFQDQHTLFPGTVLETVLIGRHPYITHWRWEDEDDIALARTALAEVGLEGMDGRSLDTLSGGERQRLALATLLCQAPAVYLLDEPSNHLDPHHQMATMDLVCRRIEETAAAAVMVLHDINLAARFCDHVLLLYGEGAAEHGPVTAMLNEENLERLYGHPMTRVQQGDRSYYFPA